MVRWVSKPQEETKNNTVYTAVRRILISKNGDRVLQPDTVPDPSDGAGGCAVKGYRQNFCATLPDRAAVTLSICAEKILCHAKIGLLLGWSYLNVALIPQYRLMYISPVSLKTSF